MAQGPETGTRSRALTTGQPTRQRLASAGVSYHLAESTPSGSSVRDKTTNLLSWYHAPRWSRFRYTVVRRTAYSLGLRPSLLGIELGLRQQTPDSDSAATPSTESNEVDGKGAQVAGLSRWLVPSEVVTRLVRRSYRRTGTQTPFASRWATSPATALPEGGTLPCIRAPRLARSLRSSRFHCSSARSGVETGAVLHRGVTLEAAGGGSTSSRTVRRDARILEGATVLGAVEIGEGAIVGARSLVLDDVALGTVVAGTPTQMVVSAENDCSSAEV